MGSIPACQAATSRLSSIVKSTGTSGTPEWQRPCGEPWPELPDSLSPRRRPRWGQRRGCPPDVGPLKYPRAAPLPTPGCPRLQGLLVPCHHQHPAGQPWPRGRSVKLSAVLLGTWRHFHVLPWGPPVTHVHEESAPTPGQGQSPSGCVTQPRVPTEQGLSGHLALGAHVALTKGLGAVLTTQPHPAPRKPCRKGDLFPGMQSPMQPHGSGRACHWSCGPLIGTCCPLGQT